MVDDNTAQTASVACLLPVQLQQLKIWYNSFLLSSCESSVHSLLGESVTAGMECMLGSAMYLKSTGMSLKNTVTLNSLWTPDRRMLPTAQPTEGAVLNFLLKNNPFLYASLNVTYHSHTRRLLSSDVLTNRRFSSTKVMVLTAPRWRSYSCTTSPVLMSHWNRRRGELKSPQSRTANEINNNIAGKGTCARWCTGNIKTQETTTQISLLATNKHTLLFKQFYI